MGSLWFNCAILTTAEEIGDLSILGKKKKKKKEKENTAVSTYELFLRSVLMEMGSFPSFHSHPLPGDATF